MKKLMVPFVVPAIGAALLVGSTIATDPSPAAAQSANGRQCFRAADVNGFTSRGRDEVDVRVGANRQYRLTLAGSCPDIDWSFRVGIRATGGGSWICHGADAEIIVPSPMGRERCLVTDFRQLTPAEIAVSRRHRRG